MAQRRVGSRRSTRILGPQREGDSMLREGVVPWATVGMMVEETLALLWGLLRSDPLGLPL